jgi:hypothetical protein
MIACIKWIGGFARKTTKPNLEKSQPAINLQPERSYSLLSCQRLAISFDSVYRLDWDRDLTNALATALAD